MPGLQGATLVELPRKLHRTLLTKRELQGRGTDISESVVHTAVMGLLLVSGEVKPLQPAGGPVCLSKAEGRPEGFAAWGRISLLSLCVPTDPSHPAAGLGPRRPQEPGQHGKCLRPRVPRAFPSLCPGACKGPQVPLALQRP